MAHIRNVRRSRLLAVTATAVVVAFGAAACSSGTSSSTAASATAAPASTDAASAPAAAGSQGQAQAVAASFTSYTSTKSFDDTVSALKQAVAGSGMMVLGDMNQAGALKTTGLSLKGAQTFFVGNPVKGKMFFQQDPAIGAVLPLRLYVWADGNGTAHVGYFDPAALFKAVNPQLAGGGHQLATAAAMIGKDASGASGTAGQSVDVTFDTLTSTKSFDDTVSALKQTVASSGMMILGDLNQAGALKTTGLNLPGAHAFFVGNPVKGKMFFQQDPAIGAAIPLGFYTWSDSNGTVHVGYFDPAALFKAVNPQLAGGGQQMATAAAMIAKGATQ
jgi:uncharacterized protein (DUF302 family)